MLEFRGYYFLTAFIPYFYQTPMQTDQTGENKMGEKSEGGEDAKKEEVIGCINILLKHF